jgi:hypothetical protein
VYEGDLPLQNRMGTERMDPGTARRLDAPCNSHSTREKMIDTVSSGVNMDIKDREQLHSDLNHLEFQNERGGA